MENILFRSCDISYIINPKISDRKPSPHGTPKIFWVLKRALLFLVVSVSCISYNEETEQKFQDNKTFMLSYLEELGYADSPFLSGLPTDHSDKQKKKLIALMSEAEIKNYVDKQVTGVPKFANDSPRSEQFRREVEGLSPQEAYDILTSKYSDLIIHK